MTTSVSNEAQKNGMDKQTKWVIEQIFSFSKKNNIDNLQKLEENDERKNVLWSMTFRQTDGQNNIKIMHMS